jgi:hypothetical protein
MSSLDRLRIVVLGYLVRGPLGGMAWSDLHYLLGLRDLGHDVWFLEDSDDYPSCADPVRKTVDTNAAYGLRFALEVFERFGFGRRWAYHDAHTATWHGGAAESIRDICADADLVLDLAGVNPLRPWLDDVEQRALVDKDPVFTQLRHLQDPSAAARAALHTSFFTFAGNVGCDGTTLPGDGFRWEPTRHPIWLDGWPRATASGAERFTTVMQWESYPAREHAGERYGTKADSLSAYLELPERVGPLELTVGGPAPVELLRAHGWAVRESLETAADPWAYRDYVGRSGGEFTVAKHAYVTSRSGWFSERSASYLASGRPVVAQETGFSSWLPSGEGVVPFSTADEAVSAIQDVRARPAAHAEAARALAEDYFDSRLVLARLLERVYASRPQAATP